MRRNDKREKKQSRVVLMTWDILIKNIQNENMWNKRNCVFEKEREGERLCRVRKKAKERRERRREREIMCVCVREREEWNAENLSDGRRTKINSIGCNVLEWTEKERDREWEFPLYFYMYTI